MEHLPITNSATEVEDQLEKLSTDLVESYETLTLIYRTVSNLGGLFRLEDITNYLLNRSLEAANATEGVIYLRGADGDLCPAAEQGKLSERLCEDAPERCIQFGRPIFIHGPLAAEFTMLGKARVTNLLSAPLETGGRVLGVLVLVRDEEKQFTTGESKLIGALCGLAAVAVANFQHYRAVSFEREMLEGVIREIGDGIIVTDDDFSTRMTNGAGRAFLGVSETEPEGFDALTRLMRYQLNAVEKALRATTTSVEFLATSRDPRRPLILSCKILCSRLGMDALPIKIICLRDVTREHLDAAAQRDFLSVASHKLRTPLTKVLGLLPIVKDGEVDAELKASAFDGIEGGANELRQLVDGILQFVEFRQGQKIVQPVAIADVLEVAINIVRDNRRDRELVVDLEVEGDATIYGSWQMVSTLLEHLIDNAVKFSPAKRVWVGIDVRVTDDDHVRISISDRGDGIAPELLERLFEPFSQRDDEFTGQADGAGLGLMLARQAVEKHGGRMSANSRLGAGSVFTVELPQRFDEEVR